MIAPWRHRRLESGDLAYVALLAVLTILAARVWWLSAIVPGQDYPQFLVFVRVAQDVADPGSPFHGTYDLAPWFIPTALPVQVTRGLALLCGGSLDAGGKLLLTLDNVGLVAAGVYLLHVLGRSRWTIVLLFPLVHSRWTVIGGFVAYATAFPWVVLGWGLTVQWLRRREFHSGVMLAGCLCVTLFWHGLAFAVLGMGFAVLWMLWRAPSWRVRATSVWPTVPSLVQFGLWIGSTFQRPHESSGWKWRPLWEAADHLLDHVVPTIPHATARALLLAGLLVGASMMVRRTLGASGPAARMWRVDHPMLVLAALYLLGFFVLPSDGLHVEILAQRFSIHAAMAAVFAYNLPEAARMRAVVVGAIAAFGAWTLLDVASCFRAFDADTRGASELMDRVGPRETLYHWPAQNGASPAFGTPNKAEVELEQFATIRSGGLPNSSFAGYGMNYVRYVHDDPMPFLKGPPVWSEAMTKFDYVLVRADQALTDRRFQRVDDRPGWILYAVCGSKRLPACP
jgi:hypothetical protein